MTNSRRKNRGLALAGVLMMLTILSILVPSLVYLIQRESKNTQSESKKNAALHLAEAGQDRGAWKLRESDTIWDNAVAGSTLTNYNNDVEFEDVDGGKYKILITTTDTVGEVAVISKGKPDNSDIVRAIRAVYSKGNVLGALTVDGSVRYKPNIEVHWGPVVSYSSITEEPNQRYPRKYSAGSITGYDEINDSNNGAMPGDNWATYDYAAFYDDIGIAPTVDLDYYRGLARTSNVPQLRKTTGTSGATASPVGSGYYTESVNIEAPGTPKDYSVVNSTTIIFVEGDIAKYPSTAWLNINALLATGDVDYNGDGSSVTVDIPDNAEDQYQHPDAATVWAANGWSNGASETISNTGFHGFLYVGGNLSNAGGGSTLVGSIYVGGTVTMNTLTLYYDQAVAEEVELSGGQMSRLSWDEIVTSW